MAIDTNGFFDFALLEPGPPGKQYSERNAMEGMALHSAEGWYAGSLNELRRTDRQASWCMFLRMDGSLVQHYPVWASCWASGNRRANTTLVSLELEGQEGTPINPAQIATLRRVANELGEFAGWWPSRESGNRTLWEHREVYDWGQPNAGPTACPSERYAPFYAALAGTGKPQEDIPMTPDERQRLENIEALLGGKDNVAMQVSEKYQRNLWLGYSQVVERVARVEQRAERAHERIDRAWVAMDPREAKVAKEG